MRWLWHIAVTCCLAAYVLVGVWQIEKPGLNAEEAAFVPWVAEASPVGRIGSDGPRLMSSPWKGALKEAFYRPILAQWGVSYLSLRLPVLLLGALALFFLYRLAKRHLPKGQALLVLALCSLDPSMIFHVKTDAGPAALSLLFRVWILLLLSRYGENKNPVHLALAGLIAGVGVWNHVDFVLFPIAALIGFFIAARPVGKEHRKALAMAAGAALVGASPFLIAQICHGRFLLRILQYFGTGFSLDLILNKPRLALHTLMSVYPFSDYFLGRIGARYTMLPHLFLFMFAIAFWLRAKQGKPLFHDRFVSAVGWTFAIAFLLLWMTPRMYESHQFFMLNGMMQLLLVAVMGRVFKGMLESPGLQRAAWALMVVPLMITAVIACVMYNRQLENRGGFGPWTTAIDEVATFCDQQKNRNIYAVSAGIASPVIALTEGRVRVQELTYQLLPIPGVNPVNPLDRAGNDPGAIFLARPDESAVYPEALEAFRDWLLRNNHMAVIVRVFENPDGLVDVFAMKRAPEKIVIDIIQMDKKK